MIELKATVKGEFTPYAKVILTRAIRTITQDEVNIVPGEPGPGVLGFGVESEFITLSPRLISSMPTSERILARDIRKALGFPVEPRREPKPKGVSNPRVLYIDIESHSADEIWDLEPEEFFRLGQYAWGANGEVVLTQDLEEMRSLIRQADLVVGHNIHAFDLTAIFGKDSVEPLEMARDGKIFDTFIFAQMALPAPSKYLNTNGKWMKCEKPEEIKRWLGLNNLAFQLDVTGKIGDLKAMAAKYGGFCHIPVDDPEFLEYAVQDIVALQEVASELLALKDIDAYDWREQTFAAICAQNSRNGFRVDIPKATARRDMLEDRKAQLMSRLVADYGFPTSGKKPWMSKVGKQVIFQILEDNGITAETKPDWKRTDTGNLSLGGDVIKELTVGTDVEELGESLAELMGQRTLAQLTLDCLKSDGKVHPDITFLQRSGRLSTTKPGLTVWSSRDPKKAVDKGYYIPDDDDSYILGFDFSNADARVVAAASGDEVYGARFVPDPETGEEPDGHMINAYLVFGEELVDSNPKKYRNDAKACSHAWNYGGGVGAILRATHGAVSEQTAQRFVDKMADAFPKLVRWQNFIRNEGNKGYIYNDWGRKMIVDVEHSYTQSPALIGQSGTREIMVDGLIKMLHRDISVIQMLKAQIHDELLFSIPSARLDEVRDVIKDCMQTDWEPKDGRGQKIPFPVASSKPSKSWEEAGH